MDLRRNRGDEDGDKYSPVGTGMEAKSPQHVLWGGERGSFPRTFHAPLTSLTRCMSNSFWFSSLPSQKC
ncbi:hypothetical protein L195_g024407 [Trifolium pratense]|uniref:Uncharacterized protein n=1 Tax=Trifolium pratense TaxID=57577 RepID=A0A2K3NDM6_TRIPR|nr:hypothetical protein L195_g024407 [Trifolium pratense]